MTATEAPVSFECVESYIAEPDHRQGIKLDDQFLITDEGLRRLATLSSPRDRWRLSSNCPPNSLAAAEYADAVTVDEHPVACERAAQGTRQVGGRQPTGRVVHVGDVPRTFCTNGV